MKNTTPLLTAALSALAVLCIVPHAFAATATWDNETGDCLYTNPLNWVANTLPGAGDDVHFQATAATSNIYLTGAGSPSLSILVFSNTAGTINWYSSDGGYVTITGIVKTGAGSIALRDNDAGFQVNVDQVWELAGTGGSGSLNGTDKIRGSGRITKGGGRAFTVANAQPGYLGGWTLTNANFLLQNANGLGLGYFEFRQLGVYPSMLMQLPTGDHVISNNFFFNLLSANVGSVISGSGDVNTRQSQVTYLGNFTRLGSGNGQYIGLVADRDGYTQYSTNIYKGDWSALTNLDVRIARGVHIFGAASAIPPANTFISINQVNITRATEPVATHLLLAGPYVVPNRILVQFPLSNSTPPSVIGAFNSAGTTAQFANLVAIDDKTNNAATFWSQISGAVLEFAGPITNGGPAKILEFRGPGTILLSAPQGNTISGTAIVNNAAVLMCMNITNSALGTDAVTVMPGCTLGGTGIISGTVAAGSGAALAPGGSLGTLNTGGDVSIGDGLTYLWEKGETEADSVAVGGTLGNLSGMTVVVYRVGAAIPGGYAESNALFTYTGADPVVTSPVILFDTSAASWVGGQVGVDTANNTVYITGLLPEPFIGAAVLLAGVLLRRRT